MTLRLADGLGANYTGLDDTEFLFYPVLLTYPALQWDCEEEGKDPVPTFRLRRT